MRNEKTVNSKVKGDFHFEIDVGVKVKKELDSRLLDITFRYTLDLLNLIYS